MEVGRAVIAAGFFGIAAVSFIFFTDPPVAVTVSDAQLRPMGKGLAFVGKINNIGNPDTLNGIGSDAAVLATLTDDAEQLAIPGASSPTLAMDGVHGMLMGVHGEMSGGRLIPVTLWFENAGRVVTRARITGETPMAHDELLNITADETPPEIAITAAENRGEWTITVETTNITLSNQDVDNPHQTGIGHAHLYLNGLKLQRMYSTTATIGALPPGEHILRVTLNTNDHRAYAIDNIPISATTTLVVD